MKTILQLYALLFLAGAVAAPAAAAERAGTIVFLRGSATIERQERKTDARLRDALQMADALQTRERSRLKALFRNDSVITLGPGSHLVVKRYLLDPAGDRAESAFELLDGKMRTVVGRGSLSVQTPTAYAAARGTLFVIWYDPLRDVTGIAVIEGGVEVRNIKHDPSRTIILTAGQMSLISGSDLPSPPQPFGPELWGTGTPGEGLAELFEEYLNDGKGEVDIPTPTVPGNGGSGGGQGGGQSGGGGGGGHDIPPEGDQGGDVPVQPPIDQQPQPVQVPITITPVFP